MINVKEMRRLRITINDLFEQLRIENCPSLSDVEYAVMESNGELSIIQKCDQEKLPLVIISDGILYESNLQKAGISKESLLQMVQLKGLENFDTVFVAFYDVNRVFHVYPVPGKNQSFSKEAI